MTLTVYSNRMSQPCRSVLLFCKLNSIHFEEINIDLFKGQQSSPEFKAINPMGKVPAIDHDGFKLFESHAILIYLASVTPGTQDHWYPKDNIKRAKVHSVLDWHHSNLRFGATKYVLNTTFAPMFGKTPNPQAIEEAEKVLTDSLSMIESFWLDGKGEFLLGNDQPSIADLSLVCEIMELELLEEKDRTRLLSPYKKVEQWLWNTKIATKPHFNDVHEILYQAKEKLQPQRSLGASSETAAPST